MITNQYPTETPEGILLLLSPAGIVPRMFAWAIDFVVRAVIVATVLLITMFFAEAGFGVFLVMYFVVTWLYPVIFEVWRDGQTIGKRVFGLQVCMDNGMPIGLQASMIRNLLILADFLPMAFGAGILSMLFSANSKRLGDHVAGTLVVYRAKEQSLSLQLTASAVMPPMVLDLDEQKAVLAFAERLDSLPKERAGELANLLTPLCRTNNRINEVLGFAKAIVGDNLSKQQNYQQQNNQKQQGNQQSQYTQQIKEES